jgi:hypothetical protein
VTVDPAFDSTPNRPDRNGIAGPAEMLAANADRDRAIDVLKAGFAEGRLTKDEYDDRTAGVYAARTYGQLAALTADLPPGPFGLPVRYPGAGYPPLRQARSGVNAMAVAALACGIGEFLTMGLTAIPAIILGHAARRQMRRTGEQGDGMALAGLTLGWIGLITAIIAGLILATSVARQGVHTIVVIPQGPNAPGGIPGP